MTCQAMVGASPRIFFSHCLIRSIRPRPCVS